MNYHASSNCLQLNFSSVGIDGLGLSIECLPLSRGSINSAETLDAQLLAGLDHTVGPGRNIRIRLLARGILLLAHDFVPLVLHEVRTGFPTCSFLLVSRVSKKTVHAYKNV